MNVSVLTGGLDDRALIEDWRDLLDDAVFATPFQTPAWTDAWWRHFGARKQPHYLVFREGRDLVGIFPLYITRGPWRSVRVVGTGQSDYLQPLVRSGHLQSVCAAIVGHLDEMGQSGVADIADLHQQRALVSLAAGDDHPVEQAICLVLDLPESYDDYLGALSKSLRFDCRRLEKRPFTDGGACVREVGLEQAQGALDAFFALHSKRWRRRGLPGAFATKRLKAFHRDAAEGLARDGQLRMSVMEVDGNPAGVIYAMQVARTRFFYQCGFDPEQKALSPGTLLVAHAIHSAITEGCTAFDFMRGDEAYKRRWTPQHSHLNMRYILPLSPLRGAAGRAFNHAGSKIEEKVRARLEGRSLIS